MFCVKLRVKSVHSSDSSYGHRAATLRRLAAFFIGPKGQTCESFFLRAKTPDDKRLLEAFDPIAEACGFDIVRVRLMGSTREGGSRRLQVMAERPIDHDITINECARLSRALSAWLEEVDPIDGEFNLEVSSPGVARPLTRLQDFDTFSGFEASLELDRMAEGRKRFRGLLAGIEDEHVMIDQPNEEETTLIPFGWIIDAKLVLNDTLMEHGANIRAQRQDEKDLSDDFSNEQDEDQ